MINTFVTFMMDLSAILARKGIFRLRISFELMLFTIMSMNRVIDGIFLTESEHIINMKRK